jgi:pimeloyl-ACP methyl ester carboxylesterase
MSAAKQMQELNGVHRETRVFSRTLREQPACSYFAYRPDGEINQNALLVSVHGITRNALEHVQISERYKIAIIAPLFTRKNFSGYQKLSSKLPGLSAEAAFELLIDDARVHFNIPYAKTYLFGYSGGAQFAHRYALKNPQCIERAVFCAAGWYTFPDPLLSYPLGFGIENSKPFADLSSIAEFPKSLVVVGSKDTARDESLNTDEVIDRLQGRNRLIRAKRWVNAMNKTAACYLSGPICEFSELKGASHSFSQAMESHGLDHKVMRFLFPNHEANSNGETL